MSRRPSYNDPLQMRLPIGEFLRKPVPETGRGPLDRIRGGDPYDPSDLIEQLIANNLDAAAVEIDEMNDLPKAANIFEWVMDPRFLGHDPFPKNLEVLAALYEDVCPRCSDPELVRPETYEYEGKETRRIDIRFPTEITIGDLMERVQPLDFGICPKCKRTRKDFVELGTFHNPNECVLVAGQRSTKTTTVVIAWSYTLHRFVMIAKPAQRYGIMKGQYLETFFTAITAEQAYKTLWKQALALYDNAPWFTQCAMLLKSKEKELGRPLYQKEKTFIAFLNKNIACTFGPPEGASQRGRTRILGAVSEWGWFAKSGIDLKRKIRANEDDIYTAVANSLITVRSACNRMRASGWFDAPNAIMLNEGSPFAMLDKGMRLLRERSLWPRVVCRHYTTFQFNPTIKPEDVDLPKDSPEYKRDYLAEPPMAADPFFEDPATINPGIIDERRSHALSYTIQRFSETVDGQTRNYLWSRIEQWPQDRFSPRVLAVDAGESQNSFALVLVRVDEQMRTIIEGVVEVIPDEGYRVSFPYMLDKVILPLCECANVRYLVWDRWQSAEAEQRARAQGVNASRFSLRPGDFRDFKQRALAGRLRAPCPETSITKLAEQDPRLFAPFPVARLLVQLVTVRQVGQQVIKPMGGTDDLFRALVLADTKAEEHRKILMAKFDARGLPISRTVGVMGGMSVMRGASGRAPSRVGAVSTALSNQRAANRWPW